MDEMVRLDPKGDGKVFVDVGCNTGTDAVMWLERWGTAPGVQKKWINGLNKFSVGLGACHQNVLQGVTSPVTAATPAKPVKAGASKGGPKVVCVEPMPGTIKMLHSLKAEIFGEDGSFEVVQAAASDRNGTVNFQDAKVGTEDAGINHGTNFAAASVTREVPVNQVTVDQLFAKRGFKNVDVLTIDTEGHDPSVIKGAEQALKKGLVRFLIFEVHQDLKDTSWATTSLYSILQNLDSWQYDCYLTDNGGKLHRLTGKWNAEVEKKYHPLLWSNVACVKKSDPWHSVLEKYNVGLM